jgi:hypothetical protein
MVGNTQLINIIKVLNTHCKYINIDKKMFLWVSYLVGIKSYKNMGAHVICCFSMNLLQLSFCKP